LGSVVTPKRRLRRYSSSATVDRFHPVQKME
jgi:hypothetical protein